MTDDWPSLLRSYRLRHGLTQLSLAHQIGVSQRTISRWERGEDRPEKSRQELLRDLVLEAPTSLMSILKTAVAHCPAPRALSIMPRLRLIAVSAPAIEKRPSIQHHIGDELIGMASGVLAQMLDDRELQRSILNREISCVVATTESVLRTADQRPVGKFRTTISYFEHDGTLYSDAISAAAPDDALTGYEAIHVGGDVT